MFIFIFIAIGSIPSELGLLSSQLRIFAAYQNQFHGALPSLEISGMFGLTNLQVGNNEFTGKVSEKRYLADACLFFLPSSLFIYHIMVMMMMMMMMMMINRIILLPCRVYYLLYRSQRNLRV